jgi:Tfp pilus assembly protein PilN
VTSTIKAPRKTSPKKQPTATRSSAPGGPGTVSVAKAKAASDGLIVGGEPRVHLLPPQVLARKQSRVIRRRLGMGLVGVIVLVAIGLGLASVALASSQNALLSAQQETTSILQQQAKYGDVLKVKADDATIQAAQKQATAQEISWQPFIKSFEATLPANASITSISADIDSPFAAAQPVTVPLQGPRIATVTATLSMKQSSIAGWLNSLPALKGFVDVTPDNVAIGSSGDYVVSITLHLNKDVLANRFATGAGGNK